MCHNSGAQSAAQIEKCVENGMPQKIVKSVQYTLKKRERRAAEQEQQQRTAQHRVGESDKDDSCDGTDAKCTRDRAQSSTVAAAAAITATTTTATMQETPSENPEVQTALKIPKMCGRFRQLQSQATNVGGASEDEKAYVDALAVGTQLTKQLAIRVCRMAQKLQHSKIYTVLTKTTQPAHVIAICILSFVLLTVWPELIDSTSQHEDAADATQSAARKTNTLAAIAYLGAFATHFGSQIWMTFVSGLSLYFSLPRHTFGQCQQILFPKYFALNSALSITMLIIFVKFFMSSWNTAGCVQLAALAISAAIEVTVRLYLAPPMLLLMHEKYKIEGAIGSGQEVGNLLQGDLVQCPHYQRIHKAFRRSHMTIAMGNMAVLLATCLHLYFLASKIQIS